MSLSMPKEEMARQSKHILTYCVPSQLTAFFFVFAGFSMLSLATVDKSACCWAIEYRKRQSVPVTDGNANQINMAIVYDSATAHNLLSHIFRSSEQRLRTQVHKEEIRRWQRGRFRVYAQVAKEECSAPGISSTRQPYRDQHVGRRGSTSDCDIKTRETFAPQATSTYLRPLAIVVGLGSQGEGES